jgi:hypothetical protein
MRNSLSMKRTDRGAVRTARKRPELSTLDSLGGTGERWCPKWGAILNLLRKQGLDVASRAAPPPRSSKVTRTGVADGSG